jgi:hypothetical protein
MLRVALEEVVAGSRHEQRPGPECDVDLVRQQTVVTVEAEAHVDHARAGVERVLDALDHVADEHRAAVPLGERGLRVDPDHADAVLGRRDHRADRRAVGLVLSPRRRLRIEQGRVGSARELRMAGVEARVDHGHALAWTGRRDLVGADRPTPPLQPGEGLGRAALQDDGAIRLEREGVQAEPDALRACSRDAPDAQASRDEGRAGELASARQLYERVRMAPQCHQVDDARICTGGRHDDESGEHRRDDPYAPHRRTVVAAPAVDYPFLRSQRAPSAEAATVVAMPKATSSA